MILKNDRETLKVIDKFFGTFVEKGEGGPNYPNPPLKVGAEMDWPGVGKITWQGAMWVDEKNQPLP